MKVTAPKPPGLADQIDNIVNTPQQMNKPALVPLSAATKDKLDAAKAFIESNLA